MTFYEQELKKLFGGSNVIRDAKYSGKTLLGRIDDELRVDVYKRQLLRKARNAPPPTVISISALTETTTTAKLATLSSTTVSYTHLITAQDRHGILHRGRIRKLMPIECWRLQGYADEQFNKAAACLLYTSHSPWPPAGI